MVLQVLRRIKSDAPNRTIAWSNEKIIESRKKKDIIIKIGQVSLIILAFAQKSLGIIIMICRLCLKDPPSSETVIKLYHNSDHNIILGLELVKLIEKCLSIEVSPNCGSQKYCI